MLQSIFVISQAYIGIQVLDCSSVLIVRIDLLVVDLKVLLRSLVLTDEKLEVHNLVIVVGLFSEPPQFDGVGSRELVHIFFTFLLFAGVAVPLQASSFEDHDQHNSDVSYDEDQNVC